MDGTVPADPPLTALGAPPSADLDYDLRRLKVFVQALERGMSWAQIGSTLGMDAKQAKKHAKDLRGACQRRVIARDVLAAMSGPDAA